MCQAVAMIVGSRITADPSRALTRSRLLFAVDLARYLRS